MFNKYIGGNYYGCNNHHHLGCYGTIYVEACILTLRKEIRRNGITFHNPSYGSMPQLCPIG